MIFCCSVLTTCVLCSALFLFSFLLLWAGGQAQHSSSKSLLVSVDTEACLGMPVNSLTFLAKT